MKRFLQSIFLTTLLSVCLWADDGLDEALAALKNRPRRGGYTERATLDAQNLVVPVESDASVSDELKDRLRALEKDMSENTPAPHIVLVPRPAPQQHRNWLTPETLENALSKADETQDADNGWIAAELDRQQSARMERDAWAEPTAPQRFSFNAPPQTPQTDPAHADNRNPEEFNSFLSRFQRTDTKQKTSTLNRYSTQQPDENSQTPLSVFQDQRPTSLSRFSEQQRPADTGPQQPWSFQNKNKRRTDNSEWNTQPSWEQQDQPITPMEQMRRSSPANDPDPFSDDLMPTLKRSIWDD